MLVGLTGGFCAGKNTAARLFASLGARVIDADRMVHELYDKDSKVRGELRKCFGNDIFSGKSVNRKKLSAIVFGNKKKLGALCRIVHPRVIKKIKREVKRGATHITIINAPLLIESGLSRYVDKVVVINASFRTRLKRALGRGRNRQSVLNIARFQLSHQKRMGYADFVLKNEGVKGDLKKKIGELWKQLNGR